MLPARAPFTTVQLQAVFQKFIHSGGRLPLKEALCNHENWLINDLLSLINFDFEENQQDLEKAQSFIFESVLKAKPDQLRSGTISCLITVGNSQFVILEANNALVIMEGCYSGGKIAAGKKIDGATFSDLKRAALIQYLQLKRQAVFEKIVDVGQFNFKDVDLNGICLLNLVFGDDAANVLGGSRINPSGMLADKNLLLALIAAGKDVRGIVLSGQNLDGVNLSGVNLSFANCMGASLKGAILTGANFTDAIFKNACLYAAELESANFTGVFLQSASLLSACYCNTIIVGNKDRTYYINRVMNRLAFVLHGVKKGEDIFYKMSDKIRHEIKNEILFSLTQNSLKNGETNLDGGPQSMFLDGNFDNRLICHFLTEFSKINKGELENQISEVKLKLFSGVSEPAAATDAGSSEGAFTLAQKILFHQSRSAVHCVLNFNNKLLSDDLVDLNSVINFNKLDSIYIEGAPNGTRLVGSLMTACFDAVLPFVQSQFPAMSLAEIAGTRSLFESRQYKW